MFFFLDFFAFSFGFSLIFINVCYCFFFFLLYFISFRGLKKSISFLNEDANLVHGALSVGNIYLDDAGEFKLFGFEFLGSLKDDENVLFVRTKPTFNLTN